MPVDPTTAPGHENFPLMYLPGGGITSEDMFRQAENQYYAAVQELESIPAQIEQLNQQVKDTLKGGKNWDATGNSTKALQAQIKGLEARRKDAAGRIKSLGVQLAQMSRDMAKQADDPQQKTLLETQAKVLDARIELLGAQAELAQAKADGAPETAAIQKRVDEANAQYTEARAASEVANAEANRRRASAEADSAGSKAEVDRVAATNAVATLQAQVDKWVADGQLTQAQAAEIMATLPAKITQANADADAAALKVEQDRKGALLTLADQLHQAIVSGHLTPEQATERMNQEMTGATAFQRQQEADANATNLLSTMAKYGGVVPQGSKYIPGGEPGGAFQQGMKQLGVNYTPTQIQAMSPQGMGAQLGMPITPQVAGSYDAQGNWHPAPRFVQNANMNDGTTHVDASGWTTDDFLRHLSETHAPAQAQAVAAAAPANGTTTTTVNTTGGPVASTAPLVPAPRIVAPLPYQPPPAYVVPAPAVAPYVNAPDYSGGIAHHLARGGIMRVPRFVSGY
jgi:hypothetical protein